MPKMKSKGTVLAYSISSVYTAVPNCISIDIAGEETETYDARTIDAAAGLPIEPTGFVKPPVISGECFYDAANAVHVKLKLDKRTPANLPNNAKITYTDAGPVSEIWSVAGIGWDEKIVGNEGVKASFKLTCSGTAS